MNTKTLILGIVCLVLVGLAFAYKPLNNYRQSFTKSKNFLAKVNFDKITKIEIAKSGKTVTVEKEYDKWKIAGTKGFYADSGMIAALKEKMDDAVKADLQVVSENKNKKSDFEANDAAGSHIKLWAGDKQAADFVLGKVGNDFTSIYITEPNAPQTYLIGVNLSYPLSQTDWQDKKILVLDKARINKIRFQYPNREFTVEKKNDKWSGTLPAKFPVGDDKISKILDTLSGLTAVNIPEQKFSGTGLDKHLIIVQVSGDGFDNTIMVGDKNKNNEYYAKRGDSDNIYLISSANHDDLDKKITDLK